MELSQSRGGRKAENGGSFASDLQDSLDQTDTITLPGGYRFSMATGKATTSSFATNDAASNPATTTTSSTGGSSSSASAASSDAGPAYMQSAEALAKWMQAEKDYWSQQPAEVRAVEKAPADERADLTSKLESEGYQVDMPVVAWGWDPIQLNFLRRQDGLPYDANLLNEAGV